MYNKLSVRTDKKERPKQESETQHSVLELLCQINGGIFIRQKEFHKKFLYADIQWVEASGNYCYIHLKNHAKVVVVEQLSRIEPMLPSGIFIRIHRSFIVNINSVDGFIGNQLCIGDIRLSVSAPYRETTMRCFTILSSKQKRFERS